MKEKEQNMQQILGIEAICYIALIIILGILAARGRLTENLFALCLIPPISLMIITAAIGADLSSPTSYPFGLIVVSLATIIITVVGYPLAKWLYRQIFPHN